LIIILKIIFTIFINSDINFLKLDLSLIFMVYIHLRPFNKNGKNICIKTFYFHNILIFCLS